MSGNENPSSAQLVEIFVGRTVASIQTYDIGNKYETAIVVEIVFTDGSGLRCGPNNLGLMCTSGSHEWVPNPTWTPKGIVDGIPYCDRCLARQPANERTT